MRDLPEAVKKRFTTAEWSYSTAREQTVQNDTWLPLQFPSVEEL